MTETVLITGGSEGIGKATALLFARKGYNVILAARDADRLAKLGLRQSPPKFGESGGQNLG